MLGEELTADRAPFEVFDKVIVGEAIGIYATNAEGAVTHHGEKMHVHVWAIGVWDAGFTAHAESLGVAAGSTIHLPKP